MAWTWRAKAYILRVIDGDTVLVRMDLGWKIWHETRVRFAHADALENNTIAGRDASAALAKKLPKGLEVFIKSFALDTYGRTLGEIYIPASREDVETFMITSGNAKPRSSYKVGGTIHNDQNAPDNINS